MPKSPLVKFAIENNNTEPSVPLTGVSCLLARTKKGPYNDPSVIINSVAQFKSLFGSEIVPDGSPSNIEKALQGGSKLRVIRVPGTGYSKGKILSDKDIPLPVFRLDFQFDTAEGWTIDNDTTINTPKPGGYKIVFDTLSNKFLYCGPFKIDGNPGSSSLKAYSKFVSIPYEGTVVSDSDYTLNRIFFETLKEEYYIWKNNGFTTIEYSQDSAEPSKVLTISYGDKSVSLGFYTKVDDELIDGVNKFNVFFSKTANTLNYSITGDGKTTVVESGPVLTYKAVGSNNNNIIDSITLYQFLRNSEYLEPVILESNLDDSTIDGVVKWVSESLDGSVGKITIEVDGHSWDDLDQNTKLVCYSTPGNPGTAPTVENWISSIDYLLGYTDVYQVACSHLDQHLDNTSDLIEVHKAFRDVCEKVQEYTYYIEVPKYKTHFSEGTEVRDKASIISWVDDCINTIGNSMWVAYFAGGLKYYDNAGMVVNSDILGTVIGLGDTAASNSGVWKSFAGMNRGIIESAHGSVSPNYGSPARYDDLNDLAASYVNLAVVKKTRSMGTRTMLWHCFTSQVKQDSFKFLSIVRLVLYMKKNLRPILDSYLEEPNTFKTWNDIYLEVKPILDQLVAKEAITEYSWNGDQYASSYADLTVNNEVDVRQGKYKAILKFKEVVPLQEISMVLSIDKASGSVNTEINQ